MTQKGFAPLVIILVIVGVLAVGGAGYIVVKRLQVPPRSIVDGDKDGEAINNFEDCVKASNPVLESYPRQCRANGQTFVEQIANETVCEPEQRGAEVCTQNYDPVCAKVNVQCIKAPCYPIRETFSNACGACTNPLVESYTNSTCENQDKASTISGSWGGEHLGMVVESTGAALDYDCAIGKIDEAIIPDKNGNFEVHGTHSPAHGGPSYVGEPPLPKYPAVYRGWTNGSKMTLTVTRTDTNTNIGTFTLNLGKSPMLFRCL
ncbi:MAG TPA: hypothetical protein VJB56_00670 [Candidatus Paceibacterota bacterium]